MHAITPGSIIGIIGGGQLGRMAALAAANLGLRTCIYTDQKDSPAAQVSDRTIVAAYDDEEALKKFASTVAVVTFEFENIPHKTVQILEKYVAVRPGWKALHIAQNRLREKDFMHSLGLKTAPYKPVTSAATLKNAFKSLKTKKAVLKTVEMGYDGKGQVIIDKNSDFAAVWKEFPSRKAVLEGFVDYTKEISVIVARDHNGGALPYAPAENHHIKGILDSTVAPAVLPEGVTEAAWEAALTIADALELVGILAVEFFLTKNNTLLVNEIAPRPHNSGHWTMDACTTSQFEQFIRAVCGLPLGSARHHSRALMKNLIGENVHAWDEFLHEPEAKLHLYGKKEARAGRKMGHVTLLLSDEDVVKEV